MRDLRPAKTPLGNSRWLLSFIDLFSVCLAFFVLMFAMQKIERGRWEQFSGAMRGQFVSTKDQEVKLPDSQPDAAWQPKPLVDGLRYLSAVIARNTGGTWKGTVQGSTLTYPLPAALPEATFLQLAAAASKLSNPLVIQSPAAQLPRAWQLMETATAKAGAPITAVELADTPTGLPQLTILPNP